MDTSTKIILKEMMIQMTIYLILEMLTIIYLKPIKINNNKTKLTKNLNLINSIVWGIEI